MNLSGNTSIDYIIDEYKYYAPQTLSQTQMLKQRFLIFLTTTVRLFSTESSVSTQVKVNGTETQNFIISCGNVRFFDLAV